MELGVAYKEKSTGEFYWYFPGYGMCSGKGGRLTTLPKVGLKKFLHPKVYGEEPSIADLKMAWMVDSGFISSLYELLLAGSQSKEKLRQTRPEPD